MKRVISLLLCALLLCPLLAVSALAEGQLVERDEPVADTVSVNAYAAIVVDMDTGEPLFEYDADEKNYPASTTKVMTAYLCLKYGDPDDYITVSKDAFSDISNVASTGNLEVGETMTVHRLLQNLLVISASEAANVVGEYISGSHEKFVDLMNEEAQALGCTGTHFANCHGLPNSDHYTTARDMSKIAMAAMQYQEFRDIVGNAYTTMEATNLHGETTIQSTNGILPGSSYTEYNYPYAIGIKTGHTNDAGFCLISAAEKEDMRLLCVVMGCASRVTSFMQTINLYDWGFDNYEALTYGHKEKLVQTEDLSEDIDATADEAETEGIAAEAPDSALEAEASAPAEPAAAEVSAAPESESPGTVVSSADDSAVVDSTAEDTAPSAPGAQKRPLAIPSLKDITSGNLSGGALYFTVFCGILLLLVILLIVCIVIAIVRKRR